MHLNTNHNEVWLPIVGFEGYYEISSNGQVRSLPNKNKFRPNQSKNLKPAINFGYHRVTLRKDKNVSGIKKKFKDGYNKKAKRILCVEKGIYYKSIKDAAISLKLHRSNITKQIKGNISNTGGYTFKLI